MSDPKDESVKPMDQREFWLALPLIIRNLVRSGYMAAFLVSLYCLQALFVISRLSDEEFHNYLNYLGHPSMPPESILFVGKFVLVSYAVLGTLILIKKSRIAALISVYWIILFCSQSFIIIAIIFLFLGAIGTFWYQYKWEQYKRNMHSRGTA
jgi:hypothetical protein